MCVCGNLFSNKEMTISMSLYTQAVACGVYLHDFHVKCAKMDDMERFDRLNWTPKHNPVLWQNLELKLETEQKNERCQLQRNTTNLYQNFKLQKSKREK